MIVEREGDNKKARFYIKIDGVKAAILEYVYAGNDKFIIEHTEVYDGYEAKGLGKLLVAEAVKYAREKHYKIIPLCPFAKSEFKKNKDYDDVLYGLHNR